MISDSVNKSPRESPSPLLKAGVDGGSFAGSGWKNVGVRGDRAIAFGQQHFHVSMLIKEAESRTVEWCRISRGSQPRRKRNTTVTSSRRFENMAENAKHTITGA